MICGRNRVGPLLPCDGPFAVGPAIDDRVAVEHHSAILATVSPDGGSEYSGDERESREQGDACDEQTAPLSVSTPNQLPHKSSLEFAGREGRYPRACVIYVRHTVGGGLKNGLGGWCISHGECTSR